jgi:CRISPR-associated endonuclease Csn1
MSSQSYTLGIDLGVNSLGVAVVNAEDRKILYTGARIFSPGFEGDFESGKEESRAAQRRKARQQRRQTDRRRRRMVNIFRLLQTFGLLPDGERETVLPKLDDELRRKYPDTEILPYFLRAKGLDEALTREELGRALYHLAQRRGFRGRASQEQDDEEGGKLKEGIEGLWREIADSGKRTLGAHLATLNPHETRIRDKRTHRRMYQEEFEALWAAQAPHHPGVLIEERRALLHRAFFHQRPRKPMDKFVGMCDLEPGEKRAPLFLPQVQHYRVLTHVNNLQIVEPTGNIRRLDDRERALLVDASRIKEKLPYKTILRNILGLPENTRFSIEEAGEKNLPVNLTSQRLYRVAGNQWTEMTPEQQADLASDLADPNRHATDEDLLACLKEKWKFDSELATKLLAVKLPAGYGSLSLKAIEKVTPLLDAGMHFAAAKKQLWPEKFEEKVPLPFLPPVAVALPEIRNPAVMRSLTEFRKAVNAVIRRWGPPSSIHIELARDLKRNRHDRIQLSKKNRDLERRRKEAQHELSQYCGPNPSRRDVEKYLLWRECNGQCPYSGNQIGLGALFGEYPLYDVEHIIPHERSLDDSFQNKTLCEASLNRSKGKRTPWEAFGHTDMWPAMVERVRGFRNTAKLKRFTMQATGTAKLLEEFTTRQLNDTRYASKLAARYAGLLFGIDRADNRRVITCAGQVTAILRRLWDMNRILNEKPEKSRDDHRHHAVDALAVALCSPAQVKALSDAASRALAEGHRRFGSLADPWDGFREQAKQSVLAGPVSHRPKRKLRGALHEETLYTAPRRENGQSKVRYRKAVDALTATEIENISDKTIQKIVEQAWEGVGRDATRLKDNWPKLRTRMGREIPIKRVRCTKVQKVQTIAEHDPRRRRHVTPGGNHHMEVVAILNAPAGEPKKWEHYTVSRLEAMERYKAGVKIVQRDHGPGKRFCFTLSEGDLVAARRSAGEGEKIWYVRSVRANGSLELSPGTDSRLKQDIKAAGALWDVALNTLMNRGARKVRVDLLGEIIECHD